MDGYVRGLGLKMEEPTLERTIRVADMLCSAHAALRDRYKVKTTALALLVLASSTWLVAMIFVEPRIGLVLTPRWFERDVWLGLLAVVTFFATLVELKLDWRGRAEAHAHATRLFAQIKNESVGARTALAAGDENRLEHIMQRYRFVCEMSPSIPENSFLQLKQHHKRKVAISRYLDSHPYASLLLLRIRWWIRDNFPRSARGPEEGN